MTIICDEIFKALGYLFISVVVYFAWKTAKDAAMNNDLKLVLWKGFLWCAGIAIFAAITLGNPSCESGREDPLYGGCEYYADDGYEPTIEQRAASFAYFMSLLYIPVVVGVLGARKDKATHERFISKAK